MTRLTNAATKQTRIVKKTVPTESFFNFFSPPKAPSDEDDDAASDIEDRLELDYQLGEDIKEKLIPRAIDWFTGEALAFEELDDDDLAEFDEDDDEEDDDVSDDHDDEDESEEDEVRAPNFQLIVHANVLTLSRMMAPSRSRSPPSASRAKRSPVYDGSPFLIRAARPPAQYLGLTTYNHPNPFPTTTRRTAPSTERMWCCIESWGANRS